MESSHLSAELLQCLTSLTEFSFLFPDRKPSLLQHVYSAQTRAMNSLPPVKAAGTAAAMSKGVDFMQRSGKNWPWCSNTLYGEGCSMILKVSFPSVSVQITCLRNIKIYSQNISARNS